jgi:arsenite methyltransferase
VADQHELREAVREHYASAARSSMQPADGGCCSTSCCGEGSSDPVSSGLYDAKDAPSAGALAASLGCGNPTALAELRPGQDVLDLGSGGGLDVLLSARRIAPDGMAYGLDMTDEMLELARRNAAEAGVDNVEFLKGYLEDIPLPDASVDVVISNCVINLAADKKVVLAEAARVLRPGGRLAFSDVIANEGMDEATKADMTEWTGCIAGALTQTEFTSDLIAAGFTGIEIRPTHRVHTHAQAAIIRAIR